MCHVCEGSRRLSEASIEVDVRPAFWGKSNLLTYLLVISLTWHTTIASTLPRRSAPLSRGGARVQHGGPNVAVALLVISDLRP